MTIRKEKVIWINPEFHKKIKRLALEKDSTIMKEIDKILEEKFDGDKDIDNAKE